ncbi:Signal transduction histidine kinase [alpha proteobacterium BAL199]|nr:Signal transduction histidine kinase [alpha proteobacterium BAL199]
MIDRPTRRMLIEDRQAAELCRKRVTSLTNIVIAIVSFVAVEPALSFSMGVSWVLAVVAIVVMRWVSITVLVRRGSSSKRQLQAHSAGATASGLAWGALPVLLWGSGGFVEFAFAGFVIAGTTAGGLSSLSWYRPAYLGYLLGATIPLATVYLLQGSVLFVAMGGLVLFYAAVLIATSVSFSRQLQETLQLQGTLEDEREELDNVRADLGLAARHKWQTLAYLSHHLRTPMNAVIGFSDLMARESLGKLGHPKYREYAEGIQFSGVEALRAINAILDVAEIETGTMTLSLSDENLCVLVAECVAEQSSNATSRKVVLRCTLPDMPASVRGDPKRLRQILDGLISNAIRFTPKKGSVTVSVSAEDEEWWTVQVSDTGIGMSADKVKEAFIPFVRLDNPLTQEFSGIGVSLTLARRLTTLHGGEFDLDSGTGRGTTVVVRLPVAIGRTVPESHEMEMTRAG